MVKHSATYTGGHLSHSPMEPNASVVWVKKDSCEVWAATQSPADIQKVLGQYAPVQLIWSREEDTTTGYYHSINAQHIEASIDENGNVDGWLHRAAFLAHLQMSWPTDLAKTH